MAIPLPKSKLKTSINATDGYTGNNSAADLITLDEHGKPPDERLPDARQAHRLYIKLLDADRTSAWNRTLVEDMVDGGAPHKQHLIKQAGMSWRHNLNFLEADSYTAQSLVAFDDLVESLDTLIHVELKPGVVDVTDKDDNEDVIAEEFTTTIRHDWAQFPSYWTRLATQFVGHGVGFLYFSDDEDWRWRPGGWGDFLMPRKTEATEEQITILIGRRGYRVDELYAFIRNAPADSKWNADEVRRAIVKARFGAKRLREWMRWWTIIEQDLKNNDLVYGMADAEEVECLHYWVREFDGTYSFYIGLEDGNERQNYLYADPHRYKNASQAFTTFTFGVGKGTYHSIRGLWWKMFPFIQVSNRVRCNALDSAALAGALLLQPADAESEEEMAFTLSGPVGYVPPGVTVVERDLPNVGTQTLPVLQDLSLQLQHAIGQYRSAPSQPMAASGDTTKYEVQANQEQNGALSASTVNRFGVSLDKAFAEQFRRIQNINPNTSAYPEIKRFYERCAARGVTPDIIKLGVSRVTAARAIGNGSPQLRLLALDELTQMAGSLDETGRVLATRDRIAARFGRAAADRYRPKEARIAPDQKLAELENAILKTAQVNPDPDDNHAVHLQVHVPLFQQLVQQMAQMREQNPSADFRQFRPQAEYATALQQHSGPHVQGLAADPKRAALAKQYAAALEQGGNLLAAFLRLLDAQDRHAQQMQDNQSQLQQMQGDPTQDPSQGQQPLGDPDIRLKAEKQQAELQLKARAAAFNEQLKERELMEKLRLEAVKVDASKASAIQNSQATSPFPATSAATSSAASQ